MTSGDRSQDFRGQEPRPPVLDALSSQLSEGTKGNPSGAPVSSHLLNKLQCEQD